MKYSVRINGLQFREFENPSETNYSFPSACLEKILGVFKIKGRSRTREEASRSGLVIGEF